MKGIVDRIENGIAVVETSDGMLDYPAPEGLRDGDFVTIEDGRIVHIDRAAANKRRAALQARLDAMMKKKK